MTVAASDEQLATGTIATLPSEQHQTEVEVANQTEFINAIGNNVAISLTGDINLTDDYNRLIDDSYTGIVIENVTGLVVDGNGFSIDGGSRMRCLYIGIGTEVEIKNLTIKNGWNYYPAVSSSFPSISVYLTCID